MHTRRQFLRGLGLATAAVAIHSPRDVLAGIRHLTPRFKVIVIGLGLPAYAPLTNWKRVGMRSSSWKHIRGVSVGACTRSDLGRVYMGSSAPCVSPRSTLCLGTMPGDLGSRSADSYKPIPWLSISYVGTVYV